MFFSLKFLWATHTWKFVTFQNFLLRMLRWTPLRAHWYMGLKIAHRLEGQQGSKKLTCLDCGGHAAAPAGHHGRGLWERHGQVRPREGSWFLCLRNRCARLICLRHLIRSRAVKNRISSIKLAQHYLCYHLIIEPWFWMTIWVCRLPIFRFD